MSPTGRRLASEAALRLEYADLVLTAAQLRLRAEKAEQVHRELSDAWARLGSRTGRWNRARDPLGSLAGGFSGVDLEEAVYLQLSDSRLCSASRSRLILSQDVREVPQVADDCPEAITDHFDVVNEFHDSLGVGTIGMVPGGIDRIGRGLQVASDSNDLAKSGLVLVVPEESARDHVCGGPVSRSSRHAVGEQGSNYKPPLIDSGKDSRMVDPITLENWVEPISCPAATILSFAQTRGPEGFTVDDLRFWLTEGFPVNPGAVLGSLCSHGRLRAIGVERSRVRSSKGRVVRRFALAEDSP